MYLHSVLWPLTALVGILQLGLAPHDDTSGTSCPPHLPEDPIGIARTSCSQVLIDPLSMDGMGGGKGKGKTDADEDVDAMLGLEVSPCRSSTSVAGILTNLLALFCW